MEHGEAIEDRLRQRAFGNRSPDKAQFMEIARRDSLKAALAWRDARFARRAQ